MDYGFIYTQNNSKYKLKEVVELQLESFQVIWPLQLDDGAIMLDIEPGHDEIIILRKLSDQVKYKMTYITAPVERSDEELIECAKAQTDLNYFG